MSIFDERVEYKPFEYSHITDPLINAMWAGHWTHNEFSFSSDIQDFQTRLTSQEQELIKRSILLISQVEVAVKSYWSNIGRLLPKPEISDMGAVFGGIEVIHSRAYSEILNKLGFNDDFQSLLRTDIVRNRVNYLKKYNEKIYANDKKQVLYSLALFTLFTENVSLFSQFYVILAFNRFRGLFKDIANVVQYTNKEERLHAEGGIALINQIRKEFPEIFDEELTVKIQSECIEAYKAECQIIDWIVGNYTDDHLSATLLHVYVKNRLINSLTDIGIKSPFQTTDPPELLAKTLWMDEEVYGSAMTDFFHKKPIDYAKKNKSFDYEEIF